MRQLSQNHRDPFGSRDLQLFQQHDPFEQFRQRSKEMFDNFGAKQMSLAMRMPFANDPFFSDSGFGHMEDMMKNMKKQMSMGFSSSGQPGTKFTKETYVYSSKLDSQGKPVQEQYRTKASGAINDHGQRIGERQQAYSHSGTGLQKMSHERMLNNQGRKVIKEKQGQQMNSYDHFKNLTEEQGHDFDRAWQEAAREFGFHASNSLGYGNSPYLQDVHRANSFQQPSLGYSDQRRGHFIPQNAIAEYNEVPFRHQTDIAPTMPARQANNAIRRQPAPEQPQTMAITDGRGLVRPEVRPARQVGRQQTNFVASKQKGPARAG